MIMTVNLCYIRLKSVSYTHLDVYKRQVHIQLNGEVLTLERNLILHLDLMPSTEIGNRLIKSGWNYVNVRQSNIFKYIYLYIS